MLEEELARLHPDAALQAPQFADFAFDDAQVLDVAGIVHLFVGAREQVAGGPASADAALRHPRTAIHSGAAAVLREAPALTLALDGALAPGADHATSSARLRAALAERLTALLSADLADPAFAPFLADADAVPHVATDDAAVARAQRNRLALERIFVPYVATFQDRRMQSVFARVRARRHTALCLSGGGIRSASFALGVIQGLARHGVLGRFDYLSTVSGGGYAGGFLSAWMARAGAHTVARRLSRPPTTLLGAEAMPIRHLRAYSHYLNPRIGLLSVDTWTLVATMLRNLLLVWLVLLPFMAAALMVPRLVVSLAGTTVQEWGHVVSPDLVALAMLVLGMGLAIAAIAFVHGHLIAVPGAGGVPSRAPRHVDAFIWRCLIPLVAASIFLTVGWELWWELHVLDTLAARDAWWPMLPLQGSTSPAQRLQIALGALAAVGAGIHLLGWGIGVRGPHRRLVEAGAIAVTGALAGLVAALVAESMFGLPPWERRPEFYATFAVPLFLLMLVLGSQVFVGLASHRMRDADREASARFNAWVLIVVAGWATVFGLSLFLPILLDAAWHRLALVGIGGLSGIAAALVGASARMPASDAEPKEEAGGLMASLHRLAMALALPAFAATVILLVSLLDANLLTAGCRLVPRACVTRTLSAEVTRGAGAGEVLAIADTALPGLVVGAIVALALAGWLVGWLVDTNRFSLHAMYRARLVRTFLRASKAPCDRAPDPFTGFDETDDLPMAALWPARTARREPVPDDDDGTRPPLHVVNLTLNVVAGGSLAWQQRKAESFTVTPLHAGSSWVGYRRTSPADGAPADALRYGGGEGVTLGTAIAVSGAAASPEAGYHSSPVVTFLMTLFNARLGWWLGNPGPAGDRTWARAEPSLAITPILDELFGLTTDRSPYVYLSDGGHFENLGLYEMVLRRNRFIVVSDAGCDPDGTFEDLGGAIRKVRIDLGVPIEFDTALPIYPRSQGDPRGDGTYWAIGRIRYSAVDRDDRRWPDLTDRDYDGVLLYVKPAFYGREPRDVYNYALSRPTFPHESTSDQFFGEAQLESYRSLGAWIIDDLFRTEFAGREVPEGQGLTRAAFDAWLDEWLGGEGVRVHTPVARDALRPAGRQGTGGD